LTSIPVKVLFASGSEPVVALVREKFREIYPELPLVVVSEFPTTEGEWIPYHLKRSWQENRDRIAARLAGRSIRLSAEVRLPPARPARSSVSPWRPCISWRSTKPAGIFMLRPRSVPMMLRHVVWRSKNPGPQPASAGVEHVPRG
jgi:hypothetical protein